jgi:hypothetical protein
MAYIGKTPTIGNFQVCDAISVVNNQAAYTMQVGGVNVSPESANHMLVSLNGILQAPTSSFTVSGSTITFASNLVTGDVIDFIQILGNVLDLGVPSDSTVSLAKLTATGTKDATTFLRGDNSFAEISSGLSVADQFRLTSDLSFGSTPTVFTANLERIDTAGQGTITTNQMSESGGNFTFPLTGIYLVTFIMFAQKSGDSRYVEAHINVTTNNSTYTRIAQGTDFIQITNSSFTKCNPIAQTLIDVTDTSLVKVNFAGSAFDTTTAASSTTENRTTMTFLRLGDT